jgi:putative PIN family toxin of toxin-antitoxin system
VKWGQITVSTADVCSDPVSPAQMQIQMKVQTQAIAVLDTNIVLDLLVFVDPQAQPLQQALLEKSMRWIATAGMRDELERVLSYPQIIKSLKHHGRTAAQVLAQFDGLSERVATPSKAGLTCKDPDDQKFIDLAVAHRATLFSKDHAVLCMKKRLLAIGVLVQSAI